MGTVPAPGGLPDAFSVTFKCLAPNDPALAGYSRRSRHRAAAALTMRRIWLAVTGHKRLTRLRAVLVALLVVAAVAMFCLVVRRGRAVRRIAPAS
jgi:hypothetical protein